MKLVVLLSLLAVVLAKPQTKNLYESNVEVDSNSIYVEFQKDVNWDAQGDWQIGLFYKASGGQWQKHGDFKSWDEWVTDCGNEMEIACTTIVGLTPDTKYMMYTRIMFASPFVPTRTGSVVRVRTSATKSENKNLYESNIVAGSDNIYVEFQRDTTWDDQGDWEIGLFYKALGGQWQMHESFKSWEEWVSDCDLGMDIACTTIDGLNPDTKYKMYTRIRFTNPGQPRIARTGSSVTVQTSSTKSANNKNLYESNIQAGTDNIYVEFQRDTTWDDQGDWEIGLFYKALGGQWQMHESFKSWEGWVSDCDAGMDIACTTIDGLNPDTKYKMYTRIRFTNPGQPRITRTGSSVTVQTSSTKSANNKNLYESNIQAGTDNIYVEFQRDTTWDAQGDWEIGLFYKALGGQWQMHGSFKSWEEWVEECDAGMDIACTTIEGLNADTKYKMYTRIRFTNPGQPRITRTGSSVTVQTSSGKKSDERQNLLKILEKLAKNF